MSAFLYALVFALGFGLLIGNYTAWALFELGVPDPTVYGALTMVAVGFGVFTVLRRLEG